MVLRNLLEWFLGTYWSSLLFWFFVLFWMAWNIHSDAMDTDGVGEKVQV